MIKRFFILYRFFTIKFLYIFFVCLGQFSEKLKLKLFHKYLEFNNYWTIKFIKKNLLSNHKKLNTLILLPHCLQYSKCIYKITFDINNCKKCMKCVVGNFLNLKEKNESINIAVATGGTLARKKIKEFIPDIIIAVACERDLISGIFDAYPFLVYGMFNSRPNGDCIDTKINFQEILNILSFLDIL